MTWPADGLPRYKAASVGKSENDRGHDTRPTGYVYDRGCAYRIVAERRNRIEGVALRQAEETAAVLNAGGELTPELRGERPHGLTKYKAEGCRCAVCRAAVSDSNRRTRERAAARS